MKYVNHRGHPCGFLFVCQRVNIALMISALDNGLFACPEEAVALL
jgi:hypothetical protein